MSKSMMHLERRQHSGPIPSPEQLREYDEVLPGCAERLVAQFEKEGDHRREQERRELDTARESHLIQVHQKGRGQHYGLAVSVLCAGLSGLAFWLKFDVAAATIATGVMVSLATVFVTGSVTANKSAAEPQTDLEPKK